MRQIKCQIEDMSRQMAGSKQELVMLFGQTKTFYIYVAWWEPQTLFFELTMK